MKIKKILVYIFLLMAINCLSLIEGKKILLGLVGLHALRKMQGMNHMHKLVTYYLPLRYAADAWKSYGKVSATTPHLPSILKSAQHQSDHKHPKSVKLTAEQSYELDEWLNHYIPEDSDALDHNYY